MAHINFEVEDILLGEANKIFDEVGLDIQLVVNMLLKRVVKEKSIAFVVSKNSAPLRIEDNQTTNIQSNNSDFYQIRKKDEKSDTVNMTKSLAIRLLRSRGYDIVKNVTFASKNRVSSNYWANPDFGLLDGDWNLILNDWVTKKIYLFFIPAHAIAHAELLPRTDKNSLIDLQIMYRDTTFTDNRSEYSFAKFLVGEIYY